MINSMAIGGVERSLLGVLANIDYGATEVHLGLVDGKGELLPYLPSDVFIHDLSLCGDLSKLRRDAPMVSVRRFLRSGRVLYALRYVFAHLMYKINHKYRYFFYVFFLKAEPIFPISFDEAYAFSGTDELLVYYVAKKVKSSFKACWIHCDVSKEPINREYTLKMLDNYYDKIFVVSKQAKAIFNQTFPSLIDKTEVRYNIIPKEQIISLSASGRTFYDGFTGTRLLTIGRISSEKGQREAIQTLFGLLSRGNNLCWYFIGDGPDLDYCRGLAAQLGISDKVRFLGAITNPYAFLKDCDIYVQPSRREGFCISIAEAKCFDKPIVTTDFTGAREQLQGRELSIITGFNPSEMLDGIEKMLCMTELNES